jgi:Ca2+-dependent lipid-binding protein
MTAIVWDEDLTSSDKVGEANIKLSSLCVNGGIDEWFKLFYKGKEAGQLHIKGQWHPTGSVTASGTGSVETIKTAAPQTVVVSVSDKYSVDPSSSSQVFSAPPMQSAPVYYG